jgi:ribosomal protein S6
MQETENENKNTGVTSEPTQNTNRVYELGYLLVPTIPEENVLTTFGNLKELVNSFGGQIISDEMPKKIVLAYTMLKVYKNVRNKFNEAYFSWIKFEMSGDKVLELKKKLDLDPEIIRFLIIKTVKENTIASKRFIHKGSIRRSAPVAKKDGENETVTEINKEEIDKEIDAMVVAS